MAITDFDRYPLTFGPSPVHPLENLTKHLGGAAIWAKREDVSSGLAFGGNKTRKLEYIVPDVLASGADTLVSIGGVQSNHTRQVAAVAAKLGLKCRLVQERWVEWDDPVNDKVGNLLLSRIMGADSRLDPAGFDIGIRDSWEEALREVEESGGTPYGIPAGASEHPLGGLGCARAAHLRPVDVPAAGLELVQQVAARAADLEQAPEPPGAAELLHRVRLVPGDGAQGALLVGEAVAELAVVRLDGGVVVRDGGAVGVRIGHADAAAGAGQEPAVLQGEGARELRSSAQDAGRAGGSARSHAPGTHAINGIGHRTEGGRAQRAAGRASDAAYFGL